MIPDSAFGTLNHSTVGLFFTVAVDGRHWFRYFKSDGKVDIAVETLVAVIMFNIFNIKLREAKALVMEPFIAPLALYHGLACFVFTITK